jgi:hypothetical protein
MMDGYGYGYGYGYGCGKEGKGFCKKSRCGFSSLGGKRREKKRGQKNFAVDSKRVKKQKERDETI